ncbi:MAG: MaoC family dehydratase N-terminal domain-containing protein [Deltaproteobacteria bacterium]|nr:MaoC family dehydratase N-terminal domain-containing protein [Deltaproteobacteria bacterium]
MSANEKSVITEELRAWIGRTSPVQPLELLSASDVRRYVDATGDANPLWLDDDFARSLGHRGRLLPPLLVGWIPFSLKEQEASDKLASFDLRRQLPVPENYTNVRNAGNETEWLKPVCLGEQLSSQSRIVDVVERRGKMGTGIYITQEERVFNREQDVVLLRRHTIALFPEHKFGDEEKTGGDR